MVRWQLLKDKPAKMVRSVREPCMPSEHTDGSNRNSTMMLTLLHLPTMVASLKCSPVIRQSQLIQIGWSTYHMTQSMSSSLTGSDRTLLTRSTLISKWPGLGKEKRDEAIRYANEVSPFNVDSSTHT